MHRRTLLKLAGLAVTAAALPARVLAETRQYWQNWSGNQQARPQAIHYPTSEAALRDLVQQSAGPLRVFGASHSFSPLVPTDETMISLEALAGARDGQSLTFAAGTRLANASAAAWEAGNSLINEPDINLQSLAGALATSTHGTGLALPSFSGMVERLRMMTVHGETLTLSKEDGDLFRAALCSLGALGIVTEMQLRGVPRYRLRETSEVLPLKEAMLQMERDKERYRHIELFAFPLGGTAILKRMELTEDQTDIFPEDTSAETLEILCELTLRAGWLVRPIQKMLGWLVEDTIRQGPAYRVFANHRVVRFNEMEYTVPAEAGLACLEEVCATMNRNGSDVVFPVEFRFSAADDSLIGMFSERAGASLSLHTYYKQDHWPFFHSIEPILQRAQGRPHWGKLHSMDAAQLATVYPHFGRFRELRRQLDPEGKLLNSHLRKVLGEPA